jgi:glycerol-3-phosphate cytidylyltransferase-like family protein
MFCPQCGATQSDELKFCKLCGTNLHAVRQAVATRETDGKFDWSKTWVAEMFLSEQEQKRRKEELERQLGITPEVKRYNEIKAGVITASVGIGLMIFLYVLMQGIIQGGNVSSSKAEILSRVWIAGVLPLFVGLGLIVNGVFVSKGLVAVTKKSYPRGSDSLEGKPEQSYLNSADTSEFIPANRSVVEDTTMNLRGSGPNIP